jgi:hypothetical protein
LTWPPPPHPPPSGPSPAAARRRFPVSSPSPILHVHAAPRALRLCSARKSIEVVVRTVPGVRSCFCALPVIQALELTAAAGYLPASSPSSFAPPTVGAIASREQAPSPPPPMLSR